MFREEGSSVRALTDNMDVFTRKQTGMTTFCICCGQNSVWDKKQKMLVDESTIDRDLVGDPDISRSKKVLHVS